LTGQRAFAGEDVTDTIVAVMSREPPWSALPSEVPAHVRALLARCLTKDPRDRLRDIGEARIALQHPLGAPVEQKHAAGPSWPLAVAAAAVVALVSGAVGWFSARRSASPPPPAAVLRAVIDPQPAAAVARLTLHAFAFTPDGREIVFAGNADDGVRALYRRNLAEPTAVRIVGTDGAAGPFVSPTVTRWRSSPAARSKCRARSSRS
jgi:eukaryotic-like serine/threonine-protein kinase